MTQSLMHLDYELEKKMGRFDSQKIICQSFDNASKLMKKILAQFIH